MIYVLKVLINHQGNNGKLNIFTFNTEKKSYPHVEKKKGSKTVTNWIVTNFFFQNLIQKTMEQCQKF